MRRLQILFLIISACLLASCSAGTVKGLQEQQLQEKTFKVPYFSDAAADYVYKAHISIYGRDFGGIFIAKKMNDTLYRAAFTTEFGNKLFDFEITDDSFKINYILEELDRKIIVNTLKRDFMLLLKKEHTLSGQYDEENSTVYKSESNDRYNYLFVDKKDGKLSKLVNATKSKEKIVINYLSENNILAKNIVIDHKNIKLRIELNHIQ